MLTILARRARPTGLALAATLSTALGACADQASTAPRREPAARSALTKGLPGGRGPILFGSTITGDEEIFSIREDGTDMKRLTYSAGLDRYAVYSPDGRKIAFVSARDDMSSHLSIFVMNADGTNVRRLTPDSTFGYIHGLAWSPDGKQIAFGASVELPPAQFDLYIIGSTGAQLRQLTNTETVDEAEPAFKPFGDRIAFRSAPVSGGPGEIWTIGSDGSIPQPLISCPTGCFGPTWSPDGWSVAYSTGSSQSSPAEVQVVNIVGVGGTPTTVAVDARYPSFSPDGIKLVYRKLVDGAYQVGTSAADGTSPTVLTAFTAGALPTSWGG